MNYTISALPTPFEENRIDFTSLENLFNYQIQNGINGIVLSGSTGEGHTLSKEEWYSLISFGIEKLRGKTEVIAGVGFNYTERAVEYAKMAEQIGVDSILATVPYYNKPQQDGIYQHFAMIAECAKKTNIILYNVPSRTATDIANETIVRLAKNYKNIIGLKDATGKLERVAELKALLEEDDVINFRLLSGEDATQIGFNAMGGNGVISVVSNINPQLCCQIQKFCENNDFANAVKKQNTLFRLSKIMFIETNPVPVKYALYKMGIIKTDDLRLPLVNLSEKSKKIINDVLKITKNKKN